MPLPSGGSPCLGGATTPVDEEHIFMFNADYSAMREVALKTEDAFLWWDSVLPRYPEVLAAEFRMAGAIAPDRATSEHQ
jgi:hypothetical protein